MEELLKDTERQRIVQHNAQVLALRDAQSHRLQIEEPSIAKQTDPEPQITAKPTPEDSEPGEQQDPHRNPLPRKSFQAAQKPSTPDSDYTPQSWSPAGVRRR